MERYEEIILRFFIEKNIAAEGAVCPAALICNEKGISPEDLYTAASSLEFKGLVKIKKGETVGDSETKSKFWIELTRLGRDVIKTNL